jgi:hypothetical protein
MSAGAEAAKLTVGDIPPPPRSPVPDTDEQLTVIDRLDQLPTDFDIFEGRWLAMRHGCFIGGDYSG